MKTSGLVNAKHLITYSWSWRHSDSTVSEYQRIREIVSFWLTSLKAALLPYGPYLHMSMYQKKIWSYSHRLHTGACVNLVLLTYLLTYLFCDFIVNFCRFRSICVFCGCCLQRSRVSRLQCDVFCSAQSCLWLFVLRKLYVCLEHNSLETASSENWVDWNVFKCFNAIHTISGWNRPVPHECYRMV